MNFRPVGKDEPDVNLTPLIDVVFLLLIFFMVSTTFDDNAELAIELPEAEVESTAQAPDETLVIAIGANGKFFLNGRELINSQLATVKNALKKALGTRETLPVTINADGKAPHQAVITAMDAARQVGLLRISFATRSGTDSAN